MYKLLHWCLISSSGNDIDISGCVCNEYRLLQVLLQQQARSTPFSKQDFYFLIVFMCWKIGGVFVCYSNISFQRDLVFKKLASLVFSTCTTCTRLRTYKRLFTICYCSVFCCNKARSTRIASCGGHVTILFITTVTIR